MVLKIVYRRLVENPDKTANEIRVDRFFDGFDNVVLENIDRTMDKDCVPNATYQFISDPNTKIVKKISLIGVEPKTIWVDDTYEIYLMSDTGKTIERI